MKLSDYLEKHDITPSAFAAKLGLQPSTVTRWIRGERVPKINGIAAIEKETKRAVTMEDFIGIRRSGPPPDR